MVKRIEALQRDKLQTENYMRDFIDKITSVRPLANVPTNKKTINEILESKIKDLTEFSSEVYDENLTLVDAIKEMKDLLKLKDNENLVLT
jgi:hypothetical protein